MVTRCTAPQRSLNTSRIPTVDCDCFRLPPIRPELNPDEWVWKNVKHDTVGRQATTGPDDFTAKVITALERLTQLPRLIRAFFGDPHLRYITA
jgi:transposase